MHSYLFPPSYAHWLADRLPGQAHESLATCDACVMLKPEGLTRDQGPFLPGLKCCTYFPYLPNFSLGAISDEKFNSVAKLGILLPVGIYPSLQYQQISHKFGKEGFGKKSELLCPFFQKNTDSCGIWNHRPGVCTSYFCKSNRGREGLKYWSKIEQYLNHFEFALSQEIMRRMGFGENELIFGQSAISPETDPEERSYFLQSAWMNWFGKEHSFYKEALKIGRSIKSEELEKILDPDILKLEAEIQIK